MTGGEIENTEYYVYTKHPPGSGLGTGGYGIAIWNQYKPAIKSDLWHLPDSNFTLNSHEFIP